MEYNSSIVSLKSLTKNYGNKTALYNVNLEIPRGKIIGLLGPNGSGKTTLIKIINGLLMDYAGEVLINGAPPSKESKAIVSYLPDKSFFGDWMKAKDALAIYNDFYEDFDMQRALALLDRLGLNLDQKIKTMSKGMIEKLQLVLVMSRRAQLYVLDEPIGGVDPAARDVILSTILGNYNPQSSLIISTHLIQDVEKIFDTIIFLRQGNVELYGNIDEIRQHYSMSIDQLFREVFKC